MDIVSGLGLLCIIGVNLYYLMDIKDLIIPIKKSIGEIISIVIGTMVILSITYFYAKTWIHIIIGVLGAVSLVLTLARKGITSKGFRSVRGLGNYGNWNKLLEVRVSVEKDVRVVFIHKNLNEDIHHYKKEDYDRIITLFREHLPNEIIKIK
ncbi:hypothetical protein [Clostridium algidicarnis]|uniref:hypothetical protein n=1 Tax=Clostridium algidicarnis TaxID=37659 RepID=UPI001C0D1EC0|nr:hypothetical protein [Clostridium algidicarnis]MBU3204873.1 hypothetical protein [Clostridium algidicarnis]MBU3213027.1 hypothetical protein [Clostridium algidicarnis]MBU3223684.1 hypothetical protein [Clostridium algidicarnis]